MEWRDQGFLLAARRHGETSTIIEVFTETHGKHAGVVSVLFEHSKNPVHILWTVVFKGRWNHRLSSLVRLVLAWR